MTAGELALLMVAIGAVLILADLFLPSHGMLSLGGALALLVAVVCCFIVSTRLGFFVLTGLVVCSPFVVMGALRVWPHTWVGKRMTLASVATGQTSPAPLPTRRIAPGDLGVALTELRPVGMCDIAGERVEAVSEHNLIASGTRVEVVNMQSARPIVRPVLQQPSTL
jgi:membrane-bound ClpP family serine protease